MRNLLGASYLAVILWGCFIASYLVAAWGWFRLRLCNCARDFWCGIGGLFVGFCASVCFGLLIVCGWGYTERAMTPSVPNFREDFIQGERPCSDYSHRTYKKGILKFPDGTCGWDYSYPVNEE